MPSASDSAAAIPNSKQRPASESIASGAALRIGAGWPQEWGSEADGKALPCHTAKGKDGLMRINPNVVSRTVQASICMLSFVQLNDLLDGRYDSLIERYVVVDCRFAEEYAGGHVKGAINIPRIDDVAEFFLRPGAGLWPMEASLPQPSKSGDGNGRKTVIVFHCEFSEKRAPES